MARWEPETRARLEQAALELYSERGFEQTTVAEIASRAGLTERTFFRYFADKREVLFGGAGVLDALLVSSVAEAPPSESPMDIVASAFDAVCDALQHRHPVARRRRTIIAGTKELQERELIKLATMANSLAGALRKRGVPPVAASLAGETGIAVFKIAFERWVDEPDGTRLASLFRSSLDELTALTARPVAPA